MDPDVEALYGLPLDEFTKARDALAREKRQAGEKAIAEEVKRAKKPSVIAWAANHLARHHADDVEHLLETGARLRRAQMAALEGGDPSELRDASRVEAGEVRALAALGRSLLADSGRAGSPDQEERLAATLRAAAVDPVGGEQLRRGVLTEELNPAGFGFGTATDDLDLEAALSASVTPWKRTKEDKAREADERARAEAEAEATAAEQKRQRERQAELQKARALAGRLAKDAAEAEGRAAAAREAALAAAARVEALESGEEAPE